MSLPDQAAAQIDPRERAPLEGPEQRPERGLRVGGRREPLLQLRIHRPADRQPGRLRQRLGHGAEPDPVHLYPERARAAGIRLERREDRQAHSSSSAAVPPTPTGACMPRSSFTLTSTSAMSGGLSRRNSLAFSRPWPMRWSP